jgi:hypothetical protein
VTHCGGEIKAEATLCKHCREEVAPSLGPQIDLDSDSHVPIADVSPPAQSGSSHSNDETGIEEGAPRPVPVDAVPSTPRPLPELNPPSTPSEEKAGKTAASNAAPELRSYQTICLRIVSPLARTLYDCASGPRLNQILFACAALLIGTFVVPRDESTNGMSMVWDRGLEFPWTNDLMPALAGISLMVVAFAVESEHSKTIALFFIWISRDLLHFIWKYSRPQFGAGDMFNELSGMLYPLAVGVCIVLLATPRLQDKRTIKKWLLLVAAGMHLLSELVPTPTFLGSTSYTARILLYPKIWRTDGGLLYLLCFTSVVLTSVFLLVAAVQTSKNRPRPLAPSIVLLAAVFDYLAQPLIRLMNPLMNGWQKAGDLATSLAWAIYILLACLVVFRFEHYGIGVAAPSNQPQQPASPDK